MSLISEVLDLLDLLILFLLRFQNGCNRDCFPVVLLSRKLAQEPIPWKDMHMEMANRVVGIGVKGEDEIIIVERSEPCHELLVISLELR